MAEQDATEAVVAGSGDLYIAPVGTTLPETMDDALDPAFVKLGLVSEDGLTFSGAPSIEEFFAWQKRDPIRREMTQHEKTITFALEQWNGVNFALAFGGGEVTEVSTGQYRYDFLDDEAQLAEHAFVGDFSDGDKHFRLVGARGTVNDTTEVQLTRSQLGLLPVAFKILAPDEDQVPLYMVTDDAAFAPVAS